MIDDRNDDTRDLFDRTLDRLERQARLTRAIRWARHPARRRHRLPLGILCVIGGLFWFLPVIGLWMLPIGLVLIAHDVPRLRHPVARFMLWIEARFLALRQRWPGRPRPRPESHPALAPPQQRRADHGAGQQRSDSRGANGK